VYVCGIADMRDIFIEEDERSAVYGSIFFSEVVLSRSSL